MRNNAAAENLMALSLELRGIRDMEPSGTTTKLPVPESIELEHRDECSATYTALYGKRVIAFQFEWDHGARVVTVEVLTELPQAEKDYLEHWLLDWWDEQCRFASEAP